MEKYTYKIISNDLENAGCIASRVKKMLIQKGIDRQTIRRVAIASYEAEINVVIHSYGGICNVIIDGNELTLEYIDDGPGIACI
ncbi:MAG: anti-sigma regulatory factor, partial [Bacilli bacterium]